MILTLQHLFCVAGYKINNKYFHKLHVKKKKTKRPQNAHCPFPSCKDTRVWWSMNHEVALLQELSM
jgi:hypothetical protein